MLQTIRQNHFMTNHSELFILKLCLLYNNFTTAPVQYIGQEAVKYKLHQYKFSTRKEGRKKTSDDFFLFHYYFRIIYYNNFFQ